MAYKTPVNIGIDIATLKPAFFLHLVQNVILNEPICRFMQ
jgi:hypothetical protein